MANNRYGNDISILESNVFLRKVSNDRIFVYF